MNAHTKNPLTATEVEADPSIIRDLNVRQKTKNRSGQKAGASKLHMEGLTSGGSSKCWRARHSPSSACLLIG